MSVLCVLVHRLCVPNIVSLGVCLKNWFSSNLARLLDAASKFTFFGVQFERRKVDKKANLHENWDTKTLF